MCCLVKKINQNKNIFPISVLSTEQHFYLFKGWNKPAPGAKVNDTYIRFGKSSVILVCCLIQDCASSIGKSIYFNRFTASDSKRTFSKEFKVVSGKSLSYVAESSEF